MTCDEVELELVTTEGALPAAVSEHLAGCDRCRAYQASSGALLADAALPEPTPEEKASLQGLAPRVHAQWRAQQRRRSGVRRFVGLAMAACVGAAVASAAFFPQLKQPAPVGELAEISFPSDSESELGSSLDTEDELEAFEVSWPSP